MATKFTAGTVINAGLIVVGVDADAPPATPSPAPEPVELLGDVTVSDIFSGQSISSVHSSGGIEVNRGSTNEGVVIELDVQSGYTYELKYFGGVGPHSDPNKVQNNQMWVATVPSGRSLPTNIMEKSDYNILKREDGSFGTVFIDTSLQPFSDPNNVDENGLLTVWSTTGTFTVPENISKVHLIFFDGNPDNTGHYVKTISVMALSSPAPEPAPAAPAELVGEPSVSSFSHIPSTRYATPGSPAVTDAATGVDVGRPDTGSSASAMIDVTVEVGVEYEFSFTATTQSGDTMFMGVIPSQGATTPEFGYVGDNALGQYPNTVHNRASVSGSGDSQTIVFTATQTDLQIVMWNSYSENLVNVQFISLKATS